MQHLDPVVGVGIIRRAPPRPRGPYPARPARPSGARPGARAGRSRAPSLVALLVAADRLDHRVDVDRRRRASVGRPWRGEQRRDLGAQLVGVREAQRREQPEADRLAVAVALVAGRRLDRVADGVAEVEHGAAPESRSSSATTSILVRAQSKMTSRELAPGSESSRRARAPAPTARRRRSARSSPPRRSRPRAPRAAASRASPGRPAPRAAGGRRRCSSSPRAGPPRSCRRRPSRPARPASSAPGPRARRAGRWRRRSRRGRRRRRRRRRGRGRRGGRRRRRARRAPARPRRSSSRTRRPRPRSSPRAPGSSAVVVRERGRVGDAEGARRAARPATAARARVEQPERAGADHGRVGAARGLGPDHPHVRALAASPPATARRSAAASRASAGRIARATDS